MSELVGSTPSLTRSGRPSAIFSRNSDSLIICAAPCFREASASSGCMKNSALGRRRRAIYFCLIAHALARSLAEDSVDQATFGFCLDRGTRGCRQKSGRPLLRRLRAQRCVYARFEDTNLL